MEITGTSGWDTLVGTTGADTIAGLEGNDTIEAGAGNDNIDGGTGNDRIDDGLGDDTVRGGDGDDYIESTDGGSDSLYGDAGNDRFYVGHSNSGSVETITIVGGLGDDDLDYYNYSAGSLVANMGSGNDHVRLYTSPSQGARLTFGAGQDVLELGTNFFSNGPVIVNDFATGDSGDALDLNEFLSRSLSGWNGSDNPFASGYLRLVQSGTATVLKIDANGGSDNFSTLITFRNTNVADFTAFNLSGFENVSAKSFLSIPNDMQIEAAYQFENNLCLSPKQCLDICMIDESYILL